MPARFQADAQQQVGFLVHRVGSQITLELLRGGIVLAGLGQGFGRRQWTGALDHPEELAALLLLVARLEGPAETCPRLAHIRIDLQQLLVELDGKVVVSTSRGLFGLLNVLGVVDHGYGGPSDQRSAPGGPTNAAAENTIGPPGGRQRTPHASPSKPSPHVRAP